MKCDELEKMVLEDGIGQMWKCYDADEVDAAIAELKEKVKFCSDFELAARKEIKEMRGQHQMLKQFGHYKISPVPGHMIEHESRQYVSYNVVCMIINYLESEITDLKKKLEDVQASHYAEMVDAGMRERRLRRSLWLARAEMARTSAWVFWNRYDDYNYNKWKKVEFKCRAKAEEYK